LSYLFLIGMNSTSQLLIQQVRLIDPVSLTDQIVDVLISGNEIRAVARHLTDLPSHINAIDARSLVLGPGLVDLYSHSGEPGHEERETLVSLTAAAAAAGFTQLVVLPDTLPPIDNPAVSTSLYQKEYLVKDINNSGSKPSIYFWGALTQGLEGKQMTELAQLAAAGVIGFADGYPITNLGLLRQLLEYIKPLHMPIALAIADSKLRGNGVMREGEASIRYGLPGDPEISEAAALAAVLEVINAVGVPVHLMRVSTRRGVELIANAKARGVPVTASTTWMHLLLNADAIESYNPSLRLEPPLGNQADMMTLVEAVKQGVIDAIAVDHTPYTYEEKTLAFGEAPPGAIGLELVLPLLWQRFVETGEWSALELWQALSLRPRLCLHQQVSACVPGQSAELVLFNPKETWIVNSNTLKSRSLNTPWLGREIVGRVVRIWNS
jgi:dihydroorotase